MRPSLEQIKQHPFFQIQSVPHQIPTYTLKEPPRAELYESLKPIEVSEDQEKTSMPDLVLVQRWVDYSSKYGIGYKLTNGVYGAVFNDHSSALMSGSLYFE